MDRAPREAAGPEAAEPAVAAARGPEAGSAAALTPAGVALLARMDAGSRARTVAALQARHGNAYVGRRLLRRVLPTGGYAYDRTTFNEQRHDGEVDPVKGTITVVLRVRYVTDGPSFASVGLGDEEIANLVAAFKRDFPRAVKGVWEDQWAIKPSLPIDAQGWYRPKVRIVEDDANPHTEITIMWPKAGFASNVERHRDVENGVMKATLTIDDVKASAKEWKHDGSVSPFMQVVAAHEFGHMIDLRHVNQDHQSGRDEYGGTYVQANDIMGYGSAVSRADYEPWLRIGRAYAAERFPTMKIAWSVVEPQW